jgi:hypothetical protein
MCGVADELQSIRPFATKSSRFLPMLLLGLLNCLSELFDCSDLRCIQRVLRCVPPDRRRIQRILDAAPIHFEGIFRRTYLGTQLRPSVPQPDRVARRRGRLHHWAEK